MKQSDHAGLPKIYALLLVLVLGITLVLKTAGYPLDDLQMVFFPILTLILVLYLNALGLCIPRALILVGFVLWAAGILYIRGFLPSVLYRPGPYLTRFTDDRFGFHAFTMRRNFQSLAEAHNFKSRFGIIENRIQNLQAAKDFFEKSSFATMLVGGNVKELSIYFPAELKIFSSQNLPGISKQGRNLQVTLGNVDFAIVTIPEILTISTHPKALADQYFTELAEVLSLETDSSDLFSRLLQFRYTNISGWQTAPRSLAKLILANYYLKEYLADTAQIALLRCAERELNGALFKLRGEEVPALHAAIRNNLGVVRILLAKTPKDLGVAKKQLIIAKQIGFNAGIAYRGSTSALENIRNLHRISRKERA
ncbi:hypothetical protein JNK13_06085 [bacterium]|nr:hypothetical protein [bacterium]